jgi:hypothetical protein
VASKRGTKPAVRRGGFESRYEPLLPVRGYVGRLVRSALTGLGLVVLSLAVGMLGYHHFEHLDWLDAFENAAMILSGMGPIEQPQSTGGKTFAGLYAIYSGFAVLIIAGLILQPVVHRGLHKFHLEQDPGD